jgi:alpha-L-fucosidase
VELIGNAEKIDWQQNEQALEISLPKEKPCEFAFVFKIN